MTSKGGATWNPWGYIPSGFNEIGVITFLFEASILGLFITASSGDKLPCEPSSLLKKSSTMAKFSPLVGLTGV